MIFLTRAFGQTADGKAPELFRLSNDRGMAVSLTNLGAAVVSIVVPDRHNQPGDVVLGYDTPAEYARDPFYFGSTIGRCANRIAGGQFKLANRYYFLTQNEGGHHLHGGRIGFNRVLWDALPVRRAEACGVEFRYLSVDGEEGYPGNLAVAVTFLLKTTNALQVDYRATSDRDTIVNLTNHTYFNLAGSGRGDIRGHALRIEADRFIPIDRHLIPAGDVLPVRGTPFDFRRSRVIGEGLARSDAQLQRAGGYDHHWILNRDAETMVRAAEVFEPGSGRVLEMSTTEPGVQFYSGNHIAADTPGKGGCRYRRYSGFCLEAQHFPDTPNRPDFPSVALRKGDVYRQKTIFRFSVR